ncbi:hypothetical protein Cus16_0343 [Curtobacterium sp. ER1/6]|nr:hypothetical protein Cus16_0343 [Curtobacterium sp. ER1/6]
MPAEAVEGRRGVARVARVDPEAGQVLGVLHRHRDQRRLRRRVRHGRDRVLVASRRGQPAGEPDARCHVHDHGVVGGAQERQRRLRHPDHARDVGGEHGVECVGIEVVDPERGTEHPGVVDQDVELRQCRDRRVHAGLVGHVELHDVRAEGPDVVARRGVAHPGVHGVPGVDESSCGLEAEGAVGSGDECRRHASTLLSGRPCSQAPLDGGTSGTRTGAARAARMGP